MQIKVVVTVEVVRDEVPIGEGAEDNVADLEAVVDDALHEEELLIGGELRNEKGVVGGAMLRGAAALSVEPGRDWTETSDTGGRTPAENGHG